MSSQQLKTDYKESFIGVFGEPQLVVEKAKGSVLTDVDGKEYLDFLGGIAVNCLGHSNKELIKTISEQAKSVWHTSNFFTSKPTVALAKKLREIVTDSFSSEKSKNLEIDPGVFFANSGTEANEAALKLVKKWANSKEFLEKTETRNSSAQQLDSKSHAQSARQDENCEGAKSARQDENCEGSKSARQPESGVHAQSAPRIIALTHSFHGRTLGALSLTSKAIYREPFNPLIPNVEFIEANDMDALEDCFSDLAYSARGSVAGMFLEVIQGEAGVVPLSAQFLARARYLTKQRHALLVVDEVQTGIGRTGSWFACANPLLTASSPIVPDIITLAKSLGAGFPIGAMIAVSKDARSVFDPGNHGTTFGGNPLGCSVALKTIEIIERDHLLKKATEISEIVAKEIVSWKTEKIVEVRGAGALIAIEFNSECASEIQKKCLENGLIVNAVNPTSIRLAPALTVSKSEIKKALSILKACVQ